jgi:hypothetical protein
MMRTIATSILLTALSISTAAQAFNPQPEPPGSATTGLAYGQTARVSVVNALQPSAASTLVCTARIALLGADGSVLAQRDVALSPGESAHLDLRSDQLRLRLGSRFPVRATVDVADEGEGACVSNSMSSLELFDTGSGRTSSVFIIDDNTHRRIADAVAIIDDNTHQRITDAVTIIDDNTREALEERR